MATARGIPILAALAAALAACGRPAPGADDERALAALRTHGCVHCHTIDGVAGASGRVGPPLGRLHERVVIAGRHPNTRENVARFILDPQAMSPGSTMPKTLDDAGEARAIADLLYRLGGAPPATP